MSEQQSEEVVVACPTTSNRDEWRVYWNAQGMPWRTKPEISGERQRYLGERRGIHPNVQQGIYPFKDVVLGSADLEWLLATHESGRGPVIWDDESQRKRQGLDLRGARLRQSYLDPDLARTSARLYGGWTLLGTPKYGARSPAPPSYRSCGCAF